MSQTAALLDADLTAYFDDFGSPMTHEPSRPTQWLADASVTLVMVLLTPLLIIPVALAFAAACIRMQRCDLGYSSAGRYRSLSERPVRARLAACSHRRVDASLVPSYRWN